MHFPETAKDFSTTQPNSTYLLSLVSVLLLWVQIKKFKSRAVV
jgi:hypothetical protein